MQPEDPAAKRLLKECMKRGIESIERSTTMSTRQAQSLYDSASESDKRVLKDMYVKSMFVTMGTAAPGDDTEDTRRARETAASMTPAQQAQMQAFMTAAVELCGLRM